MNLIPKKADSNCECEETLYTVSMFCGINRIDIGCWTRAPLGGRASQPKRNAIRTKQAMFRTTEAHVARLRTRLFPSVSRVTLYLEYFFIMSGAAIWTMIWSVPSAIWKPRQSCQIEETRSCDVYPLPPRICMASLATSVAVAGT